MSSNYPDGFTQWHHDRAFGDYREREVDPDAGREREFEREIWERDHEEKK